MEEKNQPRRPRRAPEEQTRNESLVYGKNPVTELLKSGSGVDTVLISESMAPAVAAYYTALAKEAGAAVKRVNPNKLRLMTGTGNQRHQRGEHTGQRVQNNADLTFLFARRGSRLFNFLAAEVAKLHQLIVHRNHFVADDDLILATFVHNAHHAGHGFDFSVVHAVH